MEFMPTGPRPGTTGNWSLRIFLYVARRSWPSCASGAALRGAGSWSKWRYVGVDGARGPASSHGDVCGRRGGPGSGGAVGV